MQKFKTYCVVATVRKDNKRIPLSGSLSHEEAVERKNSYQKNGLWRKTHKYFHIAKYPYKTKNI